MQRFRAWRSRAVVLAVPLSFVGGCATSVGRWIRADFELSTQKLRAEAGMQPLSPLRRS